jgi:hypothetical protein
MRVTYVTEGKSIQRPGFGGEDNIKIDLKLCLGRGLGPARSE